MVQTVEGRSRQALAAGVVLVVDLFDKAAVALAVGDLGEAVGLVLGVGGSDAVGERLSAQA